ncbi:MAG: hypothetical protein JSV65_13510 [Armatimonadota bacterium]|nr:MAG: hypothetical protein JSV65_13510 [Armatimonadota bacterium]
MPVDKVISLVIAAGYLTAAAVSGGGAEVLRTALWVGLALALIWFGDELGEYTGLMRGHAVTSTSPGALVRFFGWVFLLAPLAFILYMLLSGASLEGARSFD